MHFHIETELSDSGATFKAIDIGNIIYRGTMHTPSPASIKTKGALNHRVPKLMQTTGKRIKNKENNIPVLRPLSLIFAKASGKTCQLFSLFILLYTVRITIWHNDLRSHEL